MTENLNFQKLQAEDEIEKVIFESNSCFAMDDNDRETMQFDFINNAFEYHYNNCDKYRKYCDTVNVNPKDIQTPKDYIKVPLIHSTLFKLTEVISGNKDDIVKVCQSSGTKGTVSKVFRDVPTVKRFFASILVGLKQILKITDAFCINLGPSPEEAGDLWIAYAIGLLHQIYETENMVVNGEYHLEKVVDLINSQKDKHNEIIIVGAPVMVLALIDYINKNNIVINGCEKLHFVTAGGWKRYTGQSISKLEFIDRIQKTFSGVLSENINDVYNMVELNSVFAECENHHKHVVPWTKVLIINPEDMTLMREGEVGLIAYLDPSAKSYPCFVITDDLGKITNENSCECGRKGQILEIVRRVRSVDSRGCALKIDKKYVG